MKHITIALAVAACGGTQPAPTPAPAPPASPAVTAYVHGELRAELASARASHESIAHGGEQAARKAGDLGHHVLLGTGEPGGGADELLALDEWTALDAPKAFYRDPKLSAGFAQLFTRPVAPELYHRRTDWHTWGSLTPPAGPYWVMTVKGHLAKATEAENRAAHDAVAAGFEAQARAVGDIAHIPHTGVDDPRVFFNIDVSTNHEGMLGVLRDPKFQQAFGALFDAPPEVHVYRSTDWYQW
jgi:hypothetical protein